MAIAAVSLFALSCSNGAPQTEDPSTVGYAEPALPAPGEPVTWAEHVAPVVFEHCISCHRPGSMAPFALTRPREAARWARQVAAETASGRMPPWLPSDAGVPLEGRRLLSANEREILARWAAEGAAGGEAGAAPEPPGLRSEWQLGEPHAVVALGAPYELDASGPDRIRNFVIPVPELSGRRVRAVELDPGNRRVVHHANILADTRGRARQLDLDDPEPGYAGMVAAVAPGGHFLGWTPGKQARALPEGTAWTVEPDTDVVLQLHLMPSGKVETVQPRIGFYFTDEPPRRAPAVLHLGSTDIDLEAGARGVAVEDRWTLPHAVRVAAIYPHAHYLGQSVLLSARLPSGETRTLLNIPRWDFFWQDEYQLQSELPLPAGTELHLEIRYDNSSDNPRNPFSPPRRVRWGPSSRDEMCDVWITAFPEVPEELPLLKAVAAERSLALSRDGLAARAKQQGDGASWAALARLDLELRRYDDARRGFERAYRAADEGEESGSALYRGQLQHDLGLALVGLGRHREALGRFARALDHLESAEAAEQAVARARTELQVSTLSNLGAARLLVGDPSAAAAELEEALRLGGPDARVLVRLGLAASRQGRAGEAESRYHEALALAPQSADAHAGLGALLASQGRAVEGRRLLLRALELDPLLVEARKNLATLAALQGDFGGARRELERALEVDPRDASVHHLLGVTAIQEGRPQEAHGHFERSIDLLPEHPDAHRDWATLLAMEERHDEARPHWHAAVRVAPDDVLAIGGLADSLVREGKLQEARGLVAGAVRRAGGGTPELSDLLAQIDALLR